MSKKFKGRAGFKAVVRPNSTAAAGKAARYVRVVPAGNEGPAAGPITPPAPLMTERLYFADDEIGKLFEANLVTAVLESKDALRRAELELAAFFADAASTLRAERLGTAERAASRTDAPPQLFISLETRYAIQAFDLREKNHYVTLDAYSEDPKVRADAARDSASTSAALALLLRDDDPEVRGAARHALDDRAE